MELFRVVLAASCVYLQIPTSKTQKKSKKNTSPTIKKSINICIYIYFLFGTLYKYTDLVPVFTSFWKSNEHDDGTTGRMLQNLNRNAWYKYNKIHNILFSIQLNPRTVYNLIKKRIVAQDVRGKLQKLKQLKIFHTNG